MQLVTVFVAIAIMLGVGVAILGSIQNDGMNCEELNGGNAAFLTGAGHTQGSGDEAAALTEIKRQLTAANYDPEKHNTSTQAITTVNNKVTGFTYPADSGWAQSCYDVTASSISSYSLLVVILIVVAAVAILITVRMLY